MRWLISILFIAAPAAVTAQPLTHPPTCDVTIVRAPDDVRPIVQRWIDAEPKCRGSLQVRIIPTEGGLYLIARDDRGHTNERIVPDAQSAGVLIASWAADDGSINSPPAIAPEPPASAPPVAPATAPMPMFAPPAMAPSNAPGTFEQPQVDRPPAPRARPRTRWLSLGGLAGDNLEGARAEADLMQGHWWTLGLAASLTGAQQGVAGPDTLGLTMTDAKSCAFAAASLRGGKFELRGAIGLGIAYTDVRADLGGLRQTGSGVFGVGELSLQASYALGQSWGLTGGPVVTIYNQEFQLDAGGGSMMPSTFHRDADFAFFMGLRHRL